MTSQNAKELNDDDACDHTSILCNKRNICSGEQGVQVAKLVRDKSLRCAIIYHSAGNYPLSYKPWFKLCVAVVLNFELKLSRENFHK